MPYLPFPPPPQIYTTLFFIWSPLRGLGPTGSRGLSWGPSVLKSPSLQDIATLLRPQVCLLMVLSNINGSFLCKFKVTKIQKRCSYPKIFVGHSNIGIIFTTSGYTENPAGPLHLKIKSRNIVQLS